MASIWDMLDPEAGQRRRQWLTKQDERVSGLLGYMLGNTGIDTKLKQANEIFNPMVGAEDAMQASQRMMAPGRTMGQRAMDALSMGTEVAGAVAPAVAGRVTGDAIGGLVEALSGLGMPQSAKSAGQVVLDRLNQPGPMPTLGSNFGNIGVGHNGGPPLDATPAARLPVAATPPRVYEDVNPLTLRYSPTRRALEEMEYQGGNPKKNQGWDKMRSELIRAGAKEEELKYLGLDERFGGEKLVSKDDVRQFLAERPDIAGVRRASQQAALLNRPAASGYQYGNTIPDLSPENSNATTWAERRNEVREYLLDQMRNAGDENGITSVDEARRQYLDNDYNRQSYVDSELDYYRDDYQPDRLAEDFRLVSDLDDDEVIEHLAASELIDEYEDALGNRHAISDLTRESFYPPPQDPNQLVFEGIEMPEEGAILPHMQRIVDDWREANAQYTYDIDNLLDRDIDDRVFDADNIPWRIQDALDEHYDYETMAGESWSDYVDQMDDDDILSAMGIDEDDMISNAQATDPEAYLDDYDVDQQLADEGFDPDNMSDEDPYGDLTFEPLEEGQLVSPSDPNVIEGTAREVGQPAALPSLAEMYVKGGTPGYSGFFTPGSYDYMTTQITPDYAKGNPNIRTGGQHTSHSVIEGGGSSRHEPLLHTRSGMFKGPEGSNVFHIGEVQSDWAQGLRRGRGDVAEGPFIGNTSRWADMGLRQGIADAVLRDSDYVSLGTGQMASDMTYLPEAARPFYDETLRTRMTKLARDIFKDPKLEIEDIEMTGKGGQKYTVPAIRLTPEMKLKARREGIPLAALGGAAGAGGIMDYLSGEQENRGVA